MASELKAFIQFEKELFHRDRQALEIQKAYGVNRIFHLTRKQRAYVSALIAQGRTRSEKERKENKLGWAELGGRSQDLVEPLQEHIFHLERVEQRFMRIAQRRRTTFRSDDPQRIAAENIAEKVVSLGARQNWPEGKSDRGKNIRYTLRTFAQIPHLIYQGTIPPEPPRHANILDTIAHVTDKMSFIPEKLRINPIERILPRRRAA